MDHHMDRHNWMGDIEIDREYIPQKVEELRVHSDFALYWLILQHDSLAQGHRVQEIEDRVSPHELPDDDDNDIFDTQDGDTVGVSSSLVDNEIQEWNDLLISPQEDQNTPSHATGLLSNVIRNKILEQNTTLWSMSYIPSYSL